MCYYPRLAVRLGKKENGKDAIKFLSRFRVDWSYDMAVEKYGQDLISLPCGHCPDCTRQYARQWSVRLMLESLFYEKASFVTLTYDDSHLPSDRKIHKRDVQLFLKRLRKYFSSFEIRYFGCGEYGEQTHRPHYHLILFGVDFEKRQVVGCNELKQPCYDSDVLSSIWQNGIVSHGDVTPESCAYVARYSMKKKLDFESTKDECFLMMSTHPGIGYGFFETKKDLIYLSDRIYSQHFHGEKVPRYFDKLAENDPKLIDLFVSAKKQRILKGQQQLISKVFQSGYDSVEEYQVNRMIDDSKRVILPKRRI